MTRDPRSLGGSVREVARACAPHVLKVSRSRQGASGGRETRDPRLLPCLPQVLPANNDDSDNKSASDLSDSELCGVASASKPTERERNIPSFCVSE